MVAARIRMDADARKGCRRGFGPGVGWPGPFMDLPHTRKAPCRVFRYGGLWVRGCQAATCCR